MVPRENKNNPYAKFGGTNKEYYGIFRSGLLCEAGFRSSLRPGTSGNCGTVNERLVDPRSIPLDPFHSFLQRSNVNIKFRILCIVFNVVPTSSSWYVVLLTLVCSSALPIFRAIDLIILSSTQFVLVRISTMYMPYTYADLQTKAII